MALVLNSMEKKPNRVQKIEANAEVEFSLDLVLASMNQTLNIQGIFYFCMKN